MPWPTGCAPPGGGGGRVREGDGRGPAARRCSRICLDHVPGAVGARCRRRRRGASGSAPARGAGEVPDGDAAEREALATGRPVVADTGGDTRTRRSRSSPCRAPGTRAAAGSSWSSGWPGPRAWATRRPSSTCSPCWRVPSRWWSTAPARRSGPSRWSRWCSTAGSSSRRRDSSWPRRAQTPAAAFATLARASQHFNVRLRNLAVALVELVGHAPAEGARRSRGRGDTVAAGPHAAEQVWAALSPAGRQAGAGGARADAVAAQLAATVPAGPAAGAARAGPTSTPRAGHSPIPRRSSGSGRSSSRRPGRTCGSARTPAATCRPWARTPPDAGSTCTTRSGASTATGKHARVVEVARRLPAAREAVARDLAAEGLTRTRVLACAFRLLDLGFFRIGGEDYAAENGTFGLATLRREHVTVHRDGSLTFDYVAKHGLERTISLSDPQVYAVISAARPAPAPGRGAPRLPDDDGTWRDVTTPTSTSTSRSTSATPAPRTSGPGTPPSSQRWRSRSPPRRSRR